MKTTIQTVTDNLTSTMPGWMNDSSWVEVSSPYTVGDTMYKSRSGLIRSAKSYYSQFQVKELHIKIWLSQEGIYHGWAKVIN